MIKYLAITLLSCTLFLTACGGDTTKVVNLEPVGNTLKFNIEAIEVSPNQAVKIILKNVATLDIMKHNFILLKPGTDINAFGTAAATTEDGIPAEMKGSVIAHTAVSGPGETVTVEFTAPSEPGSYPYICSLMGHYYSMKGVLLVK